MTSLTLFFGRFHPVLVHLPIGILLLAFIFELLSISKRFKKLKPAIIPALVLGSCAAIVAAASGYFLSQEGGYDLEMVNNHQQFGIVTAVFAVVTYFFISYASVLDKSYRKPARVIVFLPLMSLMIYTGHLGGSLTHGEDFLTAPSQTLIEESSLVSAQIADVKEAKVFNDLIKPLIDQHCSSCHSAKKQKGNLRLDEVELIRKGGKHGVVLVSGSPAESELYKRVLLPIEEEHHMPPRGKRQLSSSEAELLREWILQGCDFDKKVKELTEAEKMEKAYLATIITQQDSFIPVSAVDPVNPEIVNTLRAKGIIVVPVAANSNYVSVTCLEPKKITDEEVKLLEPLSDQLLELKLSRSLITDEALKRIEGFKNLKKLFLDYTTISDAGMKDLTGTKLSYLNLVGTALTDQCLDNLSSMTTLGQVFLFGTKISEQGVTKLYQLNPNLKIDKGGYVLEKLPSDTIEYKRIVY
jgi:uncharacterized membrane protein